MEYLNDTLNDFSFNLHQNLATSFSIDSFNSNNPNEDSCKNPIILVFRLFFQQNPFKKWKDLSVVQQSLKSNKKYYYFSELVYF